MESSYLLDHFTEDITEVAWGWKMLSASRKFWASERTGRSPTHQYLCPLRPLNWRCFLWKRSLQYNRASAEFAASQVLKFRIFPNGLYGLRITRPVPFFTTAVKKSPDPPQGDIIVKHIVYKKGLKRPRLGLYSTPMTMMSDSFENSFNREFSWSDQTIC